MSNPHGVSSHPSQSPDAMLVTVKKEEIDPMGYDVVRAVAIGTVTDHVLVAEQGRARTRVRTDVPGIERHVIVSGEIIDDDGLTLRHQTVIDVPTRVTNRLEVCLTGTLDDRRIISRTGKDTRMVFDVLGTVPAKLRSGERMIISGHLELGKLIVSDVESI